MENLNIFLDYIARTNLFNFVIFMSIIIFLVKKMDVSTKLKVVDCSLKSSLSKHSSIKEAYSLKLCLKFGNQ